MPITSEIDKQVTVRGDDLIERFIALEHMVVGLIHCPTMQLATCSMVPYGIESTGSSRISPWRMGVRWGIVESLHGAQMGGNRTAPGDESLARQAAIVRLFERTDKAMATNELWKVTY